MPEILLPALFSAGSEALVAGTMAGFWTTFAVDAALGAALYALSPKPQAPQTGPQTLTVKSSNEPWKFIYGEARVGGVLTFIESTNNKQYLHLIITFAAHEVEDFTTIYFDDEALVLSGNDVTTPSKYAGRVKVYPVKVGSVVNIPPSLISETSWTTAHVEEGHAYIYFRLENDRDAFSGGLPNISAIIKGKKVYDPRTGTTAWSDNPASCIRDYMTTPDHLGGIGVAATKMDDVVITAAANICDEAVTLAAGGTQKRYTMNGVMDTGVKPRNNVKAMLTSMAGSLYDSNGKWKLRAGAYVTPTVTLDETDLAGPMTTDTAISAGMNFNAIKGQFVGPESDYQPTDYAPITSSTFEAEDGGFRKFKGDFNLPYTNTSSMAQRLAKLVLYQNRQVITIRASYKLTAFKFDVGDTVMINDVRKGFSNKPFVVTQWAFNFSEKAVTVDVVLRETNSQVYAWNAEEKSFSQDNTTLPDASTVATPTGLTLTTDTTINADGVAVPRIIATWTVVGTGFIAGYEFQYKLASDTEYSSIDGTSGRAVIQPAIVGASYDVRVRAINVFGVRSPWATASMSGVGDTTPPATPTGISAVAGNKQVSLKWTVPSDSDFDHVEIYASTTNDSATATLVGTVSGSAFTHVGLTNDTAQYYWLKAADRTGNKSAFTTSVTATPAGITGADFASSVKPVEIVSSLPAAGTQGRIVFLTTDNKLYRDTGTAWTTVVSTTDLTGTITSAQIADLAITSAKVASNAITTAQIAADAVTAGEIAAGAVGTNEIAAGAITAAKITAGTITASEIATRTITAANISAGAITATEIAADAITSAKILAGAVTATEIASGSVTTAKLAAGAVTANELAADSVIAGKIAAGAVSATEMSVATLDAITTTVGLLRTATTGERLEIASDVLRVYDAGGTLRIKFGNLA